MSKRGGYGMARGARHQNGSRANFSQFQYARYESRSDRARARGGRLGNERGTIRGRDEGFGGKECTQEFLDSTRAEIAKIKAGTEQEILSECRNIAFRKLLNPTKCSPARVPNDGPVSKYLLLCLQNIGAEYWGFISSKTNAFPGWIEKCLEEIIIDVQEVMIGTREIYVFKAAMKKKKIDLLGGFSAANSATNDQDSQIYESYDVSQTTNQIVVFRGMICLTLNSQDGVRLMTGVPLTHLKRNDAFYSETVRLQRKDWFKLHLLGYVKPYIEEMAAVLCYLKVPAPQVLRSAANPAFRKPFPYESRNISGSVPCNPIQKDIVQGLASEIEGIQGPPGTGGQWYYAADFSQLTACCTQGNRRPYSTSSRAGSPPAASHW
jgi:hypothetical protein